MGWKHTGTSYFSNFLLFLMRIYKEFSLRRIKTGQKEPKRAPVIEALRFQFDLHNRLKIVVHFCTWALNSFSLGNSVWQQQQ